MRKLNFMLNCVNESRFKFVLNIKIAEELANNKSSHTNDIIIFAAELIDEDASKEAANAEALTCDNMVAGLFA